MPANTTPIFPLTPFIGIAALIAATAITTRTRITGTTGLTQLTPTTTNGLKIPQIIVKGSATTVASKLCIWIYDGTNSTIFDEIDIPAITAGNTTESYFISKNYETLNDASIILPPTYQLFVSQTVASNVNIYAIGGLY